MILPAVSQSAPDILDTEDVRFVFLGWKPQPFHDEAEKTPITIISGFLGAGKTSLLVNLLEKRPRGKFGLVINDVGEVNIDSDEVRRRFPMGGGRIDLLKELTQGCICCTMGDALADALVYLHEKSYPAHVLVEASGVANPRNILQAFYTSNFYDHSLLEAYRIHNLVTVLDTPQFLNAWLSISDKPGVRRHLFLNDPERPYLELVMDQIDTCDVLVLNKADLMERDALNQARMILKGLNPRAKQWVTVEGRMEDIGDLLDCVRFDLDEIQNSALLDRHLHKPAPDQAPQFPALHPPHHHHDHQGYGLQTMIFRARRPFHTERFFSILRTALPEVIRAKGYYWADQYPDQCGLLSLAGGILRADKAGPWFAESLNKGAVRREDMPDTVKTAWLDDELGDRRQEIVLIGTHLDREAITAKLESALIPEEAHG